jgi:Uma2 family endonuclease
MATIETTSLAQPIHSPITDCAEFQLWRFSVKDYARMRETGILHEDDRVELIDGKVRVLSPIGPWHAEIVNRLSEALVDQRGTLGKVSVQNPVQLDDYSEPQPDLLLLKAKPGGYRFGHPQPNEVILAIEVSDSTIDFDRKQKIPRYAAAGIPEVWIVDLEHQQIEQYSQLVNGRFAPPKIQTIENVIESVGLPRITIDIQKLFA